MKLQIPHTALKIMMKAMFSAKKTVTDYAKASGAFAWMTDDEFYNLGTYYLRSPFSATANYCIQYVNHNGDATRTYEIINYPPPPSVCPAMFINMK